MISKRILLHSLSVLILLTSVGLAQQNDLLDSLKKADSQSFQIPSSLQMLNSTSFHVSSTTSSQVSIAFKDSQQATIGTLLMFENLLDGSLTLTFTESSGSDWAKFEKAQTGQTVSYSVSTSSGKTLLSTFSLELSNSPGRSETSSVSLKVGGTAWQSYSTADVGSSTERTTLFQAYQSEELRIFDTARLGKLREVLRGLDVLAHIANSSNWEKEIDPASASSTSPLWNEPIPEYQRLAPGCGGSAFCIRVTTIAPLFVCNGGNSCSGVYFIPAYVVRAFTMSTCGYLNNCA